MTALEQERGAERARQRRRRLTEDEQREIANLYAEPNASADEIRARYGIGPSTLYRVLSRFGVSRRGGSATTTAPQSQAASGGARGRGGARARASSSNGRRGRASTTAASGSGSSGAGAQSQRFRVAFKAERVVSARDVRDALRQADQFGARDIFAITPAD